MAKRVTLPDGSVVNFPDEMSEADIGAALSGLSGGPAAPAAPAPAPAASAAAVPGGIGGALTEFGGGVKQGLGDIYGMVRHPQETAEALWGLVESSPVMVERLAQKDTRSEALPSLFKGAAEAQAGTTLEEAKRSPWRAAGRFTGSVAIPGAVVKGAVRGARVVRAGRAAQAAAAAEEAARAAQARPRLVRPVTPPTALEEVVRALQEEPSPQRGAAPTHVTIDKKGNRIESVELPEGPVQPPVSYPPLPKRTGPPTGRIRVADPSIPPPARLTGTSMLPAAVETPTQPLGRLRLNLQPQAAPANVPLMRVGETSMTPAGVQVPTQPPGQIRMSVPVTPAQPPTPPRGANLVRAAERPALPPPNTNVQTAIADALADIQNPPPAAPVRMTQPATPPTAAPPVARTLPPELPESWKPLVQEAAPETLPGTQAPTPEPPPAAASPNLDAVRKALEEPPATGGVDIQAQPGMGLDPEVVQTFRESLPGGGDLADARRAVGSEKAARSLDDLAAELGVDRSVVQEMMRNTTDGPSRRPMAAELAEMDNDYLRRIMDPRGSVPLRTALTAGGVAGGGLLGAEAAKENNPVAGGILGALAGAAATNPVQALKALQALRVTGMLSGAAAPKSALGNVGAVLTAAAENQSMAPLREAMNLGENARNFRQGWRTQANPAGTSGVSRFNVFGRGMGALDEMTTQLLQRSGLTLEEAQRLLLTSPNPLGHGKFARGLESAPGRFFFPFQRTPINSVSEGLDSIIGAIAKPGSGPGAIKRGLTYGAGAAGAAAGSQTDNPLLLALGAALAGPRALPFALGAGLTAGPQVIERVGVGLPEGSYKDLFDPLRSINKPALMKLLESGGR